MEHWLERAAAMPPQRVAVAAPGTEVTYAELFAEALAAAGALRARGVKPGERVALALPAGSEFVAALHGCWLAGAVAVPIDLRLTEAERALRSRGVCTVVDSPLSETPL